jgi:hypothetical protein
MGATAHLYLPVYDKIQITTSYEYLEIRHYAVAQPCVLLRELQPALKGLSHEIDFKNVDKKFTELGLTKGFGWFLNFFRGSNDFKMQKVYLLRLIPF